MTGVTSRDSTVDDTSPPLSTHASGEYGPRVDIDVAIADIRTLSTVHRKPPDLQSSASSPSNASLAFSRAVVSPTSITSSPTANGSEGSGE